MELTIIVTKRRSDGPGAAKATAQRNTSKLAAVLNGMSLIAIMNNAGGVLTACNVLLRKRKPCCSITSCNIVTPDVINTRAVNVSGLGEIQIEFADIMSHACEGIISPPHAAR